jgi:hypothetical protein
VASQVVTLDQLSGGRAILTVGLGAIATDLPDTGEEIDLHTRAAQMDEGIDLIRALWDGGHAYQGRHYSYSTERNDLTEVAQPVQKRIPIWVVGVWNRPKSMRRVLHCDGIVPHTTGDVKAHPTTSEISARGYSTTTPRLALTSSPKARRRPTIGRRRRVVQPWVDAGATWWLETRWEMPHNSDERMAEIRDRIAAGPPP